MNPTQSLKTSLRRAEASRRNSLHSTGPKSRCGKMIVAANPITHGLFSARPVVEGLESSNEWARYRACMLSDLAPAGAVEQVLAERIALSAWRLRRVHRYEIEQIRLPIEMHTQEQQDQLENNSWKAENLIALNRLQQANASAPMDSSDAEAVMWRACRSLPTLVPEEDWDDSLDFDEYWEALVKPVTWTAGAIREMIATLARQYRVEPEKLLERMQTDAAEDAEYYSRCQKRTKDAIRNFKGEHLLPSVKVVEKIIRYESHLHRLFHRDLHELQRLQALRFGFDVAAPVAVDVDITAGSGTQAEPESS